MDLKPLIKGYTSFYNRLSTMERVLLVLLILILFSVFYFGAFVRPMLNKIASFKKQKVETEVKTKVLLSQLPELSKVKGELELLKQHINDIELKTTEIKGKLINTAQIPQLLTALIKCAQGMTIDFQSVKQKVATDKEGLSRLYIELQFECKYEDVVNYIKNIEEISPVVKLEELDVTQSKTDPRNLISTYLKLSTLLALEDAKPSELPIAPAQASGPRLTITKSPLIPKLSVSQTKKKVYKLTGITYRGPGNPSSAIINDTVVKEGDTIEGAKVEQILADSVKINDGLEGQTLKVER